MHFFFVFFCVKFKCLAKKSVGFPVIWVCRVERLLRDSRLNLVGDALAIQDLVGIRLEGRLAAVLQVGAEMGLGKTVLGAESRRAVS